MKVLLYSADINQLRSADSTSLNGTYLVYQIYNSDPHVAHLHPSQIIAVNDIYYGDTTLYQYTIDTLRINILVKPLGKIALTLYDLQNINKVTLGIIDTATLEGHIRNSFFTEFQPLLSDTLLTISGFPDRNNELICWFNGIRPGEFDFDTIFYMKAGDTTQVKINH